MARLALVLAAGVALAAAPATAQTARPAPAEAPRPLAYRLPAEALPAEALPAEALPAEALLPTEALLPAPRVRPDTLVIPPDEWVGRDKVLHFGASFLLTLSGQYVYTDKANLSSGAALPLSAGTALAIGVAKEVADSRRAVNPLFSLRDLAADALGVALGALVTRL